MFTVFTPTYNRGYILNKLYQSLKNQSYKDFEWLIIDDGSTDNTRKIVDEWISENNIKIRYFYKKNSGKQKTYNLAIKKAQGEFFICIDSDDQYTEDALEKILIYWSRIKNKNKYAGLTYLSMFPDGKLIGTEFPKNEFDSNHFDIYYKYNVKGDKGMMFRTSVLREFYFPEIAEEHFITEGTLYNRISRKYKTRYINEKLEIKDYQENGLTTKYKNLMLSNPKGSALYFNEKNFFDMKLLDRVLSNAVYIKFSLISKKIYREIYSYAIYKKYFFLSYLIGKYMHLKGTFQTK